MEEYTLDNSEHCNDAADNLSADVCDSNQDSNDSLRSYGYFVSDTTSEPDCTSADASSDSAPFRVMLLKNNRNNNDGEPYIEETSSDNHTLESRTASSKETPISVTGMIQSHDLLREIPRMVQSHETPRMIQSFDAMRHIPHVIRTCDAVPAIPPLPPNYSLCKVVRGPLTASSVSSLPDILNHGTSVRPYSVVSSTLPVFPTRLMISRCSNNRYDYCAYCRIPLLKSYTCLENIPLYYFCKACYTKIQVKGKEPASSETHTLTEASSFGLQRKKRGSNMDPLIANLKTKNNDQNLLFQPKGPMFSAACRAVASLLKVTSEDSKTGDGDTMPLSKPEHSCAKVAKLTNENQTAGIFNQSQRTDVSALGPSSVSILASSTKVKPENVEESTLSSQLPKQVNVVRVYPAGPSAVRHTADQCDVVKTEKESVSDTHIIQDATPVPISDIHIVMSQETDHNNQKNYRMKYACQTCDKSFEFKSQLLSHSFIHSDKFACSECGRRFHSSGRLARHAKTHTKSTMAAHSNKKQTGVHVSATYTCPSQDPAKNTNANAPCVWCKKPGPVCCEEECWQRRRTCVTCGLKFPTLKRLADHRQSTHVPINQKADYCINLAEINPSPVDNNDDILNTLLEGDDIGLPHYDVDDFLNDCTVVLE